MLPVAVVLLVLAVLAAAAVWGTAVFVRWEARMSGEPAPRPRRAVRELVRHLSWDVASRVPVPPRGVLHRTRS